MRHIPSWSTGQKKTGDPTDASTQISAEEAVWKWQGHTVRRIYQRLECNPNKSRLYIFIELAMIAAESIRPITTETKHARTNGEE